MITLNRIPALVFLVPALALILALASACGTDDDVSISGDVDSVITAAAEAMGEVDSARFTIERGGAPVGVGEDLPLSFEAADGRYSAPASADAVITATLGDATIEVGAVAIEGETWVTNPVTGRWEAAPESLSFDSSTMFDPELGWRPLLESDLDRPRLISPEPDEENQYGLRGIAGAERIAVLTGGLVDQAVPIEIWVDADSGYVVEARFETESEDGVSQWRLLLSDYGAEVEIERPDLEAGA